ncbi:MAG TPA: nucleotidyl transferase AbiEii/AbiGii toxin family protein [Ohtaekwangia sp.]
MNAKYKGQVELLLTVLPVIAREKIFALKGGTAINLFVRDMPRLSVDIDLTYVVLDDDRPTALDNISRALNRVEADIKNAVPGISITRVPEGQGDDVKLNCQAGLAHIKIEVNTSTRGILFPVRELVVSDSVQSEFKKFAAINVVSHPELYGGKICAALDRQHPRDLFDMHVFFLSESITEEITQGVILFLLSHARPMHELLMPHFLDQREAFEHQFAGMTSIPFTYEDFETARQRLVTEIHKSLTPDDKKFLLSFNLGKPQWALFPLKDAQHLPAIKWKLLNLAKLKEKNPDKHAAMHRELVKVLS